MLNPLYAAGELNGMWDLIKKSKNSEPVAAQKRLLISQGGFSAMTFKPINDKCALTGSYAIAGDKIEVSIGSGDCPPPENPGSSMSYKYSLSQDSTTLTLDYKIDTDEITEKYLRHDSTKNRQACTHSYCGIWNRVATYVSGQLMHNEPAYTIITDQEYYSSTNVCFNTVSIESITNNLVSGTMLAHNCPLGPYDPQPPGTKIFGIWKLSEYNNILTIDDSRFGPTVTTRFKRIE